MYERQQGMRWRRHCAAFRACGAALPDGAYFSFPGFEHYGMPSAELCMHLLETAHVATTAGSVFGPAGEHHLRLVYNAPVEQIEEGVARIAESLSRIGSASADSRG